MNSVIGEITIASKMHLPGYWEVNKNDLYGKKIVAITDMSGGEDEALAVMLLSKLSGNAVDIRLAPNDDAGRTDFIERTVDAAKKSGYYPILVGIGDGELGNPIEIMKRDANETAPDNIRIIDMLVAKEYQIDITSEIAIPIGVSSRIFRKYRKYLFHNRMALETFDEILLTRSDISRIFDKRIAKSEKYMRSLIDFMCNELDWFYNNTVGGSGLFIRSNVFTGISSDPFPLHPVANAPMYRNRENYLRFGTDHIFINFTEDNLKDLEVINETYGHGVKLRRERAEGSKVVMDKILWSGKIHIFLSFIDLITPGVVPTLDILKKVKNTYGRVFKITVHMYGPIPRRAVDYVKHRDHYETISSPDADIPTWGSKLLHGIIDLIESPGHMNLIAHKIFKPVSFENGFTKITVQQAEDTALEIVTHILTNTRKTNVMLYQPYILGPTYDRRRIPDRILSK